MSPNDSLWTQSQQEEPWRSLNGARSRSSLTMAWSAVLEDDWSDILSERGRPVTTCCEPQKHKEKRGQSAISESREIAHCLFFSEIHASVERYCPVSSRRRDPAERRGIDVQVRVTPDRPVQDIDCVGAKCERSIFADPHFLAQSHIQTQRRRPSDARHIYSGVRCGSRLRVF